MPITVGDLTINPVSDQFLRMVADRHRRKTEEAIMTGTTGFGGTLTWGWGGNNYATTSSDSTTSCTWRTFENGKSYIWESPGTTCTHSWTYSSTAATTCSCDWEGGYSYYPVPTPSQALRTMMRDRLAPRVLNRRFISPAGDIREQRARETLRTMVGDRIYDRYLRRGSITLRAQSGLVYQIFPGHDFTRVYKDGQQIEQLCVVLRGNFPPTDSLIMRYLLILNNEALFRKTANKWQREQTVRVPHMPAALKVQPSLVELFQKLKDETPVVAPQISLKLVA